MQTFTTSLIILTAGALFSCGGGGRPEIIKADSIPTVRIAPDTKVSTQVELFDSIGIVSLEATSQNLIGQVSTLMLTDSLMIITDKYTQSIQAYDRNGHFLRKIGNQGKSGNEYIEIAAAALTPDQKQVAVADVRKQKILFYSVQDGTYTGSVELPYNILGMQYIDNDFIAVYSPLGDRENRSDPTLTVMNSLSQKTSYQAFPSLMSLSRKFTFSYTTPLKKSGGTVLFAPNLSDTVYRVTPNEVEARFAVAIEKDRIPQWTPEMTTQDYMALRNQYVSFTGEYAELDSVCWIQVSDRGQIQNYFLSKRDGITYRLQAAIKTGNPLALFFTTPVATDEGSTLICPLPPEMLDDCTDMLTHEQQAIISGKTNNDMRNPLLLFFHVSLQKNDIK